MGRYDREQAEAIRQAIRSHGHAMDGVRQAVALRLGLNITDLQVLTLLFDRGPLTASAIAQEIGLTSGAVTGIIDRLERGGWAVRESAAEDRRRVMVRPRTERRAEIRVFYDPLFDLGMSRLGEVRPEQLDFLLRFLTVASECIRDYAAQLRRGARAADASPEPEDALSAALGQRKHARLELRGGAANLSILGEAPRELLYQARFEGAPPRLDLSGDVLRVDYPRTSLPDQRRQRGTLALSTAVRWDLRLRGGGARLVLDLSALRLGGLELAGGVSDVTLALPRPEGKGRIRVSGGVNGLSVSRPEGVAMRLHLSGGAARLALDAQRLGAVGGEVRLETPDAARAPCWELEVSGGVSTLSVAVA